MYLAERYGDGRYLIQAAVNPDPMRFIEIDVPSYQADSNRKVQFYLVTMYEAISGIPTGCYKSFYFRGDIGEIQHWVRSGIGNVCEGSRFTHIEYVPIPCHQMRLNGVIDIIPELDNSVHNRSNKRVRDEVEETIEEATVNKRHKRNQTLKVGY